MVSLYDLMDMGLLNKMIDEGYVTARPHNKMPWVILNYTPKAQYEWVWNEVTLQARGLVYRTTDSEVIARPFKKFFNWDQGVGKETWQNNMPPPGPVIRMEKMDGSLGILVADGWDNGAPTREVIATRGSFHSEQAEWATEFYVRTVIEQIHTTPLPFVPEYGKTYLFEIIYPENRIVVNYGDYKGLVLIDVIDNETGVSDQQEFDDCLWPDKVTRKVLPLGFDSGQAAEIPEGDEGFVYYWPSYNYRVKMKSAEYIELHRIVSNLSEKTIWEQLMANKTVDQIKAGVPDEFHDFVESVAVKIMEAAGEIMMDAAKAMASLAEKFPHHRSAFDVPRKDFALAIKDHPLRKYLFLMLDRKDVYPVALAAVKPKADKPLVSEEDV